MKSVFIIILLSASLSALGQGVQAAFSSPASACINEKIKFGNQSTGAVSYEWDFCSGDLDSMPFASVYLNNYGGYGTRMEFVEENNNYYGFFFGKSSRKLFRLDFGNSLSNQPQMVDLGGLGVNSSNWQAIEIVKDAGVYYGLIADFNSVMRISFGVSVTNPPSEAETIYMGSLISTGIDIALVSDVSERLVFVASFGNDKIARLRFPSSFGDPVLNIVVDDIPVAGAVTFTGLAMIKSGTTWYAMASSLATGKVFKLSFGNGVENHPSQITSYAVEDPVGIAAVEEGGTFYTFVQSRNSNASIFRLKFGNSMAVDPIQVHNINGIGISGSGFWGFSMYKARSEWLALSVELTGSSMHRVSFENTCGSDMDFSRENTPSVILQTSGVYRIALTAHDNTNTKSTVSAVITVGSEVAPAVTNSYANICTNNPTEFTAQGQVASITSYTWNFGDGNQVITGSPSASHTYMLAGEYVSQLEVVAANGCRNHAERSIKIYDPPVANFSSPPSPICTNTQITFINTTPDVFDGMLEYTWSVDGTVLSTARNLITNFNSSAPRSVELVSNIPGCLSNKTILLGSILEGPAINFDYEGHCSDQEIKLHSLIPEPVQEIHWTFGDGGQSESSQPVHVYRFPGTYEVSLMALSANGCRNAVSKAVQIDSTPFADFNIEGPPSSCSGSSSKFLDLTPAVPSGEVESWQWNFGDGNSSAEKNPSHTYVNSGTYDVEMTAVSDQGCSDSTMKSVTIQASPTISFGNGPVCLGIPAQFISSSNENVQYYWEIGASYYESQNISHTFNAVGTHAVRITVVAENGCTAALDKNVVVPQPIIPSFTVTNNCKGFEAVFKSISNTIDPVVSSIWNFADEGGSTDQGPLFTFNSLGDKSIMLQVTTASGCTYQRQQVIAVIEPPIANFSALPEFGVPPQEISFINKSLNATFFEWDFGDGTLSQNETPKHEFTALGDFEVQLTASNNAGCKSVISKSLTMVSPLPDVELSHVSIVPDSGNKLKVIVTIANKGNTVLKNLPVMLDLSGKVALETTVTDQILPFSQYNLILDYTVAQQPGLRYLCASTTLEGDLHPEGNRICVDLEGSVVMLTPYPNPSKDFMIIEWVSIDKAAIRIQLLDSSGRTCAFNELQSKPGLNRESIDVRQLADGAYLLRISTKAVTEVYHVSVSK